MIMNTEVFNIATNGWISNGMNAHKEENCDGHVPPRTIDDLEADLLDALMETSCRWWVIGLAEKKRH